MCIFYKTVDISALADVLLCEIDPSVQQFHASSFDTQKTTIEIMIGMAVKALIKIRNTSPILPPWMIVVNVVESIVKTYTTAFVEPTRKNIPGRIHNNISVEIIQLVGSRISFKSLFNEKRFVIAQVHVCFDRRKAKRNVF